jgi:hypothetical protein
MKHVVKTLLLATAVVVIGQLFIRAGPAGSKASWTEKAVVSSDRVTSWDESIRLAAVEPHQVIAPLRWDVASPQVIDAMIHIPGGGGQYTTTLFATGPPEILAVAIVNKTARIPYDSGVSQKIFPI